MVELNCDEETEFLRERIRKNKNFWVGGAEKDCVNQRGNLEKDCKDRINKYVCEYPSAYDACIARETAAYVKGSIYGVYVEEVPRPDAWNHCKNNGGKLATISSDTED